MKRRKSYDKQQKIIDCAVNGIRQGTLEVGVFKMWTTALLSERKKICFLTQR